MSSQQAEANDDRFTDVRHSRFSMYVNSSLLTHISVHHRLMKRGFTDIFTPLTLTRLSKAVVDCYRVSLLVYERGFV